MTRSNQNPLNDQIKNSREAELMKTQKLPINGQIKKIMGGKTDENPKISNCLEARGFQLNIPYS